MFAKKPRTETELFEEIFALVQRNLEIFDLARKKKPTMLMKARGASAEFKIDENIRKILIMKLDGGCSEADVMQRFMDDVDSVVQDTTDSSSFGQPHKEYIQDMLVKMFG